MEFMMERRLVATPKSFFIKERDGFYADWQLSFWREFFQNSVDAGSKSIAISVTEEKGRGSFDEPGNPAATMTRVVFQDDGCGMTQEVLDKVYFAIGQTTKEGDGASVGGYGRARLMTCFSQARYSILTTDRFVMGDGPDYVNWSLEEAEVHLGKAIAKLSGDDDASVLARKGLESDLAMVREARAGGGFKGCRVEVDVEQTGRWSSPTVDRMSLKLREYLSESQIPCSVTVNGKTPEEHFGSADKIQARRGPVKRTLSAVVEGEKVDFATVHTSEGDKARHKGLMIVRVDGASMYSTGIEAKGVQVILEIRKDLSRAVLNSNRDGLKPEYREAVESFVAELNVDDRSALAEKQSRDNYTIKGERGVIVAVPPSLRQIANEGLDEAELGEAREIARASGGGARRSSRIDSMAALRSLGISEDQIEALVNETYFGKSFVYKARFEYGFPLYEEARKFCDLVTEKGTGDWAGTFLAAPDELKEWMASVLSRRWEAAMDAAATETEQRIKDLHDVHVAVISANEKTRAAIRRNDPRKWSVEDGKGRAPRALLSAWTAACSVAVETLMAVRPATEQFSWTTGWVYSVPEETHEGDRYRNVSVAALCQTEDGNHRFLLNPVNEDGTLRYSVSDAKDRQRLMALAMHEVGHVLEGYHNETYAGILTDLMKEFDMAAANRRMKGAVRAVMAAYEKGRARVQAMDSEPGRRPAERLMDLASANGEGMDPEAVARNDDGTWTVDSDRLQDRAVHHKQGDGDDYRIAASSR